jgi:hypothetical protein
MANRKHNLRVIPSTDGEDTKLRTGEVDKPLDQLHGRLFEVIHKLRLAAWYLMDNAKSEADSSAADVVRQACKELDALHDDLDRWSLTFTGHHRSIQTKERRS